MNQTSDRPHFELINRYVENNSSYNISLIKGKKSNNLREYCNGQVKVNSSLNCIYSSKTTILNSKKERETN